MTGGQDTPPGTRNVSSLLLDTVHDGKTQSRFFHCLVLPCLLSHLFSLSATQNCQRQGDLSMAQVYVRFVMIKYCNNWYKLYLALLHNMLEEAASWSRGCTFRTTGYGGSNSPNWSRDTPKLTCIYAIN